MENHLTLLMPLSLEELLLRRVAALFCSNSDYIKLFYELLDLQLPTCEMKEWLKATEEKMLKLGLPESFNEQVIDRIQAIGLETREWKERNGCQSFEAEIELPDISKLCWTSTGTIHYRKLAEQYVLCDPFRNRRRLEIACLNCMENHIPHLWHELSEEEKWGYGINRIAPDLNYLWPHILEGKQSKLDDLWRESGRNLTSFNQWVFEESAKEGNQIAAEYFFQKLTPEEREVSLMRAANNVTDGNVLFYLLSLMTPEQQMEIVKARPVYVMLCFLHWPRRHLLPENAGLIWTFLQESDYDHLLQKIIAISRRGDKCFPNLFQEFFMNAPHEFIKKCFVGHESDVCPPACGVLCQLAHDGDSESIEVMFRHADAASRVKLVFCDKNFNVFDYCMSKGRWDGVEACLRGAALSKEDKGKLKESFLRFTNRRLTKARAKYIFRRFFQLLNEDDESDDKEKKVKKA